MITGIGAIDPQLSQIRTDGVSGISSGTSAPASGVDAGNSFAEMVSEAATRTIGTLEQAEQVSVQALQGDADMRQVADAVMSAEQALQAAVAIRDKIVSSYLEVSRMAI
ncbi:flagellar hook-basal body complex protein FliE [Pseudaminobacter sp. NGMCC 1.201702]|uniref:flagellar hook-basal body complex protein FliE n=1 Tax=Pseudaminobacter sp. NGMCC 1.201702 TaxID=3391825 RepID=UPI0039F08413